VLPQNEPSEVSKGKVDHITALQDGIGRVNHDSLINFKLALNAQRLLTPPIARSFYLDGLSLAMFEALRKLRDAVAPESGNLGVNSNAAGAQGDQSTSAEPDMDELWHLYRSGDKDVVAKIHNVTNNVAVTKREDFVRIHAKMEMEKDTELVAKLAESVLEKSDQIDDMVDSLPGMNRTREEQMKIIEGLISLNQQAARDLENAHRKASERRAACREFIQQHTCEALGIDEPDRADS
jgi:Subunit 21 of Mediator complex